MSFASALMGAPSIPFSGIRNQAHADSIVNVVKSGKGGNMAAALLRPDLDDAIGGNAAPEAIPVPPPLPELKPDDPEPKAEPIPVPASPLSSSLTAAQQRARQKRRGGGAPADLTLSSRASREDDRSGTITRPTLLGR